MRLYQPDCIYIEQSAINSSRTQQILSRCPDIQSIILDDSQKTGLNDRDISLSEGKKALYLKQFPSTAFKLCPGFSENVLCCNYYVLDLVENCPLECTYCILQAFLNRSVITFHVNVDELVDRMIQTIKSSPHQPFRVGTGEHSDSIALDHIFNVNPFLVETFAHLQNATLELKTKTDRVSSLIGLNHNQNTVIAWSLNPIEIIKHHELKTASLKDRLKAAQKVIDNGYGVAFHFDPIILYKDWEKGYQKTIEMLFDMIPAQKIAWISMGTLRYIPMLKQIAEDRFPGLSIFSNEFTATHDGKMRYLKPIRKQLIGKISNWIQRIAAKVPLYICMEKHSVWEKTMGIHPKCAADLERHLNTNIPRISGNTMQGGTR